MKRNSNLLRFAAGSLAFFYLTGCSTIHGRQNSEQMVLFEATPREIQITCAGETVVTPGSISLKQSRNHTCHAELEGYEKKSFRVRSHVSEQGFKDSTRANADSWGWWTLGIGILVGWTVDLVSGAMRNLEHNDYHVTLHKEGTTSAGEAVIAKTVDLSRALLSAPKDIVDSTAGTVMDTTLRASSEKVGIESRTETVHYPAPDGPEQI